MATGGGFWVAARDQETNAGERLSFGFCGEVHRGKTDRVNVGNSLPTGAHVVFYLTLEIDFRRERSAYCVLPKFCQNC